MVAGDNNGHKESRDEEGCEHHVEGEAEVPAVSNEHDHTFGPVTRANNEQETLKAP